eukprot:CAMPEP_0184860356 /NCGR_PEP_ID=MMETSP0580-20130426/5255_1 /TAXON_ID=1118495 /ORGANISM="Dactyliosolen fragilissimus" /LENGTH=79 /DNA_ID=CAMNT_0027357425 /DNA_START=374 /DNA_END=613 /DNA_ORIENTATION=+
MTRGAKGWNKKHQGSTCSICFHSHDLDTEIVWGMYGLAREKYLHAWNLMTKGGGVPHPQLQRNLQNVEEICARSSHEDC